LTGTNRGPHSLGGAPCLRERKGRGGPWGGAWWGINFSGGVTGPFGREADFLWMPGLLPGKGVPFQGPDHGRKKATFPRPKQRGVDRERSAVWRASSLFFLGRFCRGPYFWREGRSSFGLAHLFTGGTRASRFPIMGGPHFRAGAYVFGVGDQIKRLRAVHRSFWAPDALHEKGFAPFGGTVEATGRGARRRPKPDSFGTTTGGTGKGLSAGGPSGGLGGRWKVPRKTWGPSGMMGLADFFHPHISFAGGRKK